MGSAATHGSLSCSATPRHVPPAGPPPSGRRPQGRARTQDGRRLPMRGTGSEARQQQVKMAALCPRPTWLPPPLASDGSEASSPSVKMAAPW
ncbi:hypothetical protein LUU34_00781100 [Aix galericulata]|nr:hypothetical protein LUU34_00781100 [Aix galericulata]